MPNNIDYLAGLPPRDVELWKAQADYNADNVDVVIDRANITVAASDTWSYVIPFRLVGQGSNNVIPYSGTIGAAISQTGGTGQTPTVSSATPSVVMGSGTVTIAAGSAGGWGAGEIATLTLTYTDMRANTHTDTLTVTMS